VVDAQAGVGPKHPAGAGIDARRAGRAEVAVEPAFLDDRRGRSVAVLFVDPLRLPLDQHGHVVDDTTGIAIHANGAEADFFKNRKGLIAGVGFEAALGVVGLGRRFQRGREPDLPAFDYGRRPAASGNACLPGHVFRFAPGLRQARGQRVTLAIESAPLRKILGGGGGDGGNSE